MRAIAGFVNRIVQAYVYCDKYINSYTYALHFDSPLGRVWLECSDEGQAIGLVPYRYRKCTALGSNEACKPTRAPGSA